MSILVSKNKNDILAISRDIAKNRILQFEWIRSNKKKEDTSTEFFTNIKTIPQSSGPSKDFRKTYLCLGMLDHTYV